MDVGLPCIRICNLLILLFESAASAPLCCPLEDLALTEAALSTILHEELALVSRH